MKLGYLFERSLKRFSKYFKEVEESSQQRALAHMHSVLAAILVIKETGRVLS